MFHLFRKKIEKRCAYCEFGSAISETAVACPRKGVMDAAAHCRRFRYDPFKRVPPRPSSVAEHSHSPEEFTL